MTAAEQSYTIKKGDTLSGIAKTFGHRKWESIWKDGANRALVSKRKVPEAIQPGDKLVIPLTEAELAKARQAQEAMEGLAKSLRQQVAHMRTQIATFDEIISDQKAATDKVVGELEDGLKGLRRFAGRVDMVSDVATGLVGMYKSLLKLSLLGRAALKSHGIKLSTIARHAGETLKEIGKDQAKDKLKDRAEEAMAEHKDSSNTLVATAGTAADWLVKVGEPSFWASAVVKWQDGKSIAAALSAARTSEIGGEIEDRIKSTKQQSAKMIAGLQAKRNMVEGQLREAQKVLAELDGRTK